MFSVYWSVHNLGWGGDTPVLVGGYPSLACLVVISQHVALCFSKNIPLGSSVHPVNLPSQILLQNGKFLMMNIAIVLKLYETNLI